MYLFDPQQKPRNCAVVLLSTMLPDSANAEGTKFVQFCKSLSMHTNGDLLILIFNRINSELMCLASVI